MLIKTRLKSSTELSSYKILAVSPVLVVTTTIARGFAMALCFAITLILAQLIVSLFKKSIPLKLRSLLFVAVTAFSAAVTEILTIYFFPAVAVSLDVYLPILAVSCVILIQLESTKADESFGMGILNSLITCVQILALMLGVSLTRELFGNGTLFSRLDATGGIKVFDTAPVPILSSTVGLLLLVGIGAAFAKLIVKKVNAAKRSNGNEFR